MRLESDAYTIHIEVPENTDTADLRVTVNGKPIPVAQTGLELPQDPVKLRFRQNGLTQGPIPANIAH